METSFYSTSGGSVMTKIIVENLGCDSYTSPSPVALFDDSAPMVDNYYQGLIFRRSESEAFEYIWQPCQIKINDFRCIASDDNGQIMVQVAWVKEIDLHGIQPQTYLRENFFFDRVFIVNEKIDFSLWSEVMIMNLYQIKKIGIDYALKMIELLGYTGKSEFRKSLQSQVLNWISEENHKYNQPLSWNQYSALTKFDRK
jgi:hypothetical protein